jgi:hypothetical protein
MAVTGKIAEVVFEEYMDRIETQDMLLPICDRFEPDPATLQNSNNVIWRTVEQQRPVLTGWDLTGQEQDIIEETYPALLGEPNNDLIAQRADDLRDMTFWRRAGRRSAERQASEVNKTIASRIATQGSLFYRFDTNTTSPGYKMVANAQTILNERQGTHTQRHYVINDRDQLTFSGELSGRQTLAGRPESNAWMKGQIGENIAEFDVYTGSYLPNLVGGASPDTTVTGDQSFAPEAGTVSSDGAVVTNVDYRTADIPVAASAGYNVGDKVTMGVNAIGLDDKTGTGQLMTFTVVAIPDGTTLTVFPKPIALDDPGLTDLEKAYANIDTQIADTTVVSRVNTDASAKTNIFWDQDAVEVYSGTIPAEKFKEFDGLKVITDTMKNGQKVYMLYDANIINMQFRYRIFTWWNVTIKDPSRCGCAVTFST